MREGIGLPTRYISGHQPDEGQGKTAHVLARDVRRHRREEGGMPELQQYSSVPGKFAAGGTARAGVSISDDGIRLPVIRSLSAHGVWLQILRVGLGILGERRECRGAEGGVQRIDVCVPDEIATDGGPPFTSHSFESFLSQWGIRHRV